MTSLRHTALKLAPLIALALFPAACKSSASDKGAATGKNITRAADEIQVGIGQLDATVSALTAMVNNPATDLAPQYKAFATSLSQLEATAKKVRDAAAEMETNGQAYFADWDAQIAAIQNEDIRERTAERRKVVEANLKELKENYTSARDGFQPLMSDLQDIRTVLGADLTMEGLDSVKKTVNKTTGRADDVKESLQELSDGFRKLGVRLSQSGPPPPAAETPKK